jgi:hypothetical protein
VPGCNRQGWGPCLKSSAVEFGDISPVTQSARLNDEVIASGIGVIPDRSSASSRPPVRSEARSAGTAARFLGYRSGLSSPPPGLSPTAS